MSTVLNVPVQRVVLLFSMTLQEDVLLGKITNARLRTFASVVIEGCKLDGIAGILLQRNAPPRPSQELCCDLLTSLRMLSRFELLIFDLKRYLVLIQVAALAILTFEQYQECPAVRISLPIFVPWARSSHSTCDPIVSHPSHSRRVRGPYPSWKSDSLQCLQISLALEHQDMWALSLR